MRGAAAPPSDAPRIALIYGLGDIEVGNDEDSGLLGRGAMRSGPMRKALSDAIGRCRHQGDRAAHRQPRRSYVASDTIWREVQRAREKNKRCSSRWATVAASGGYMIAARPAPSSPIPARSPARSACWGKIVTRGLWDMPAFTGRVKAGANADIGSANTPFSPAGWNISKASLDYSMRFPEARRPRAASSPPTPRAPSPRARSGPAPTLASVALVDELGGLSTASASPANAAGVPVDAAVRIEQFPRRRAGSAWRSPSPPGQRREGRPRPDDIPLSHRLGDIAALLVAPMGHRPRCAAAAAPALSARPAQVSGAFLLVEIGEILDLDCVIGNRATISSSPPIASMKRRSVLTIHIRPLLILATDPCLIWRVCPISSCDSFKARRTSARSISSRDAALGCRRGLCLGRHRARSSAKERLRPSSFSFSNSARCSS